MSNFCYGKQKQTSVNLCSAKYLINHFQWRTCQYNIIYFFMNEILTALLVFVFSGTTVFVFVFVLYLYFVFSCFHDTRKRSADYLVSLIYENLVINSNTLNSKKLFKISFFLISNLKWFEKTTLLRGLVLGLCHWFENGSKKIDQCCTKGIW